MPRLNLDLKTVDFESEPVQEVLGLQEGEWRCVLAGIVGGHMNFLDLGQHSMHIAGHNVDCNHNKIGKIDQRLDFEMIHSLAPVVVVVGMWNNPLLEEKRVCRGFSE